MVREKWIVGVRNKLATLAAECDSLAAINGARMSVAERAELQNLIRAAYKYIETKIG